MNEFELYEALCMADAVAAQYPAAGQLRKRIAHAKEMFSDKKYRLAVVGEFKRGKSSLINALVGSSLLPTDICPTTAVIGWMVYGEDKRILVYYKNGKVDERTVGELREYATKLGSGGEERAALIREIIIKYPSIFCQNGIEIIDTPGLNDDEQMSETTLGVLGETDSVLVTISAAMPLSLTERSLIMTLIEHDTIRHITFVVTFIDRVSDERVEQDRLIGFIRNRLQTEVLQDARKRFDGSKRLLEKAEKLLGEPVLFAVSSMLAMKGFDSDNQEMLKASRFPEFKQALFEMLISGQDVDRCAKAKSYICELSDKLGQFYAQSIKKAEVDFIKRQEKGDLRRQYFSEMQQWIKQEIAALDEQLEKRGFYPQTGLCDTWMEQLTEIIKNIYERNLRGADASGETKEGKICANKSAVETMLQRSRYYEKWAQDEFLTLYSRFADRRAAAGLDNRELDERVQRLKKICPFPEFKLSEDAGADALSADTGCIGDSLKKFGRQISAYIAKWRRIPAEQFLQDSADRNSTEDLDTQKSFLRYNYVQNRKTLDKCLSVFECL